MQPLADKVALITGASSGIGAASALMLAEAGCKLVLAARSMEKLTALATRISTPHLVVPCDVTVDGDLQRLHGEAIEQFGQVDILFANAGVYTSGTVATGDPKLWDALIETNINGVMKAVRQVLPGMLEKRSGDIVVMSSVSGFVEGWSEPIYGASKHAIKVFAHSLRRQVADAGIRVGVIAPGKVATELWRATDKMTADQQTECREALSAEDVARAVLFMLSQPRHVTIRDLVLVPQSQNV